MPKGESLPKRKIEAEVEGRGSELAFAGRKN